MNICTKNPARTQSRQPLVAITRINQNLKNENIV